MVTTTAQSKSASTYDIFSEVLNDKLTILEPLDGAAIDNDVWRFDAIKSDVIADFSCFDEYYFFQSKHNQPNEWGNAFAAKRNEIID